MPGYSDEIGTLRRSVRMLAYVFPTGMGAPGVGRDIGGPIIAHNDPGYRHSTGS